MFRYQMQAWILSAARLGPIFNIACEVFFIWYFLHFLASMLFILPWISLNSRHTSSCLNCSSVPISFLLCPFYACLFLPLGCSSHTVSSGRLILHLWAHAISIWKPSFPDLLLNCNCDLCNVFFIKFLEDSLHLILFSTAMPVPTALHTFSTDLLVVDGFWVLGSEFWVLGLS